MPDRFLRAPDAAWVDGSEDDDPKAVAWVARVPDGIPVALEGPAWLLWISLADSPDGDTVEGLVQQVEQLRGADTNAEVNAATHGDAVDPRDVARFLGELVEAGLVIQIRTPSDRPEGD
jgi:hypothetical protein